MSKNTSKKIVITGINALSSCGIGFDAIKENLSKGVAPSKVQEFKEHSLPKERSAFTVDFEPKEILGRKGLRTMDKATKMLLSAIHLQWNDEIAALPREERPGTVVATAFGSVESIGNFITDSIRHGVSAVNPNHFGNTVINSPGGNANIRFDLPHLSATMAGGFDSGLEGLIYASDHIQNGYGDSLLTAGLEEASVYQFLGSDRDGYLSATDEMKPFGKESNGFVLGEGVAVALIESEEHATKRGAKVLATIEGYYSGFDAPRDGSVATKVINLALEEAGITAEQLSFVVSDANGLAKVDAMRLSAIKDAVGSQTPVTCYKTVFGETWGAAGMLDLAGALADMQEKRISPIQGSFVAMDGINLVREEQKMISEYVLLTSLTSEGNCSAIVIKNS